jgi:hypothetical protein
MSKIIVILTGSNNAKNLFDEVAKTNGYWLWHINSTNVLSKMSREFYWDGTRDEKYFEYIKKLEDLVNEYYDFKRSYLYDMIQKFRDNDRANLLVLHSIGQELSNELKDSGAFTLHLVENNSALEVNEESYDKVIVNDTNFTNTVVDTLKILGK